MTPGLLIDAVLLIFLGLTLFIGIRLSRQFSEIRKDQNRIAELIGNLNIASGRAEKAVQSMKQTAIDTGESLQGRIGQGQALSEELEIMIEAGDSLAERLQKIAESSRKAVGQTAENRKTPSRGAVKPGKDSHDKAPRTRAERELVEALKPPRDRKG